MLINREEVQIFDEITSNHSNMEHLTVALEELYKKNKASSLSRMTRSRGSSKKSGGGSDHSGYQDSLVYACKNVERTVTLPLVAKGCSCANVDVNASVEDGKYRLSLPRRQRSGSDVVIVQLFTERYDHVRHKNNFSLEPPRSHGMISPQMSPLQQRRNSQRYNAKPLAENLLVPNFLRTPVQNIDAKKKVRNEASVASGFTQIELKIHNDREKQRSNVYILSEEDRSKRIVEEWLKTLPY